MKRVLICIEYNGSCFEGWQVQPEKRTVQGELETILSSFFNEKVELTASGRTDSGVHAINQYAHFDISKDFQIEKLPYAVNSLLPIDVSIRSAKFVDSNFNARFDVKRKTYEYKLYSAAFISPIKNGFFAHVKYDLNIEEMKKAARHLIGTHDFSAFVSSGSGAKSNERTIYEITIENKDNITLIEITGNGFLYNMVRIIVGTLVDVGRGRLKPRDVKSALESGDRQKTGKTMPACGLYLKNVEY